MSKEEKLNFVGECALSIIATRGIESLNHSRLARMAKVSRPWLYKYAGKTREEITDFAIDYFGKMFAHMERPVCTDKSKWVDTLVFGIDRMLANVEKFPWLIILYFKYSPTETAIGKRARYVKSLYLAKTADELSQVFGFDKATAKARAEMVAAVHLTIAFHWLDGGFKKNSPRQITLDSARMLFAAFQKF